MKKFLFIIALMLIFSVPAAAQTPYQEQYDISGAEDIYDSLDQSTKKILEEFSVDPADPEWVNELSATNVFSRIWDFVISGAKGPLAAGFSMLAVLLAIAAAGTFEGIKIYEDLLAYVFALVTAVGLLSPVISFISSCTSALKGITTLMTAFVPVYAGILTASGRGLTASGMSFLLLSASSVVSNIASFMILPMMNCYLGVGLAGSVMPMGGMGRLNEGIKKTAIWTLSLVLTVFLGLLSIQTGVNRAADGLGVKTARFMIGTFVPVAGGALSESLTTLIGSLGLLKSSVGMFGIIAVALIIIPCVIELLLWRGMLFVLGITADLLGVGSKTEVLRAADCVLAVMLGIMLFTGALFIISLAVTAGG